MALGTVLLVMVRRSPYSDLRQRNTTSNRKIILKRSVVRRSFHIRESLYEIRQACSLDLDRSNRTIQFSEFGRGELHRVRADVLKHVRHLRCAGNGHNPWLLRHQPCQCDLSRCGLFAFSPVLEQIDKRQVVRGGSVRSDSIFCF